MLLVTVQASEGDEAGSYVPGKYLRGANLLEKFAHLLGTDDDAAANGDDSDDSDDDGAGPGLADLAPAEPNWEVRCVVPLSCVGTPFDAVGDAVVGAGARVCRRQKRLSWRW